MLILIVVLSTILPVTFVHSRPMKDQILRPPPRERGVRMIRNKAITFTQEQPEYAQPQRFSSGIVTTLFTVKGRSRPNRSGRVLSLIPAGATIQPFRISNDKKWVAAKVVRSGIQVWIPRSAVPDFESRSAPNSGATSNAPEPAKKPAPKESEDTEDYDSGGVVPDDDE